MVGEGWLGKSILKHLMSPNTHSIWKRKRRIFKYELKMRVE